jgi:hypothetical protein
MQGIAKGGSNMSVDAYPAVVVNVTTPWAGSAALWKSRDGEPNMWDYELETTDAYWTRASRLDLCLTSPAFGRMIRGGILDQNVQVIQYGGVKGSILERVLDSCYTEVGCPSADDALG